MSRRKPLTCQSNKVCIVIRKNKSIPIQKLKEYCSSNFVRYAFIEHKGDIKPENGEVEGIHYHLVGEFKGSKVPFSTRLNTLCTFFKFDNANGIEIDQYSSFEGSLQYLTHKNNAEKTPHNVEDIIHNMSDEDFNIFYNAQIGNVITFDLLFTSCLDANNIIDVIKKIGISNYRTWRNVVWDIWNTMNEKQDFFKQ